MCAQPLGRVELEDAPVFEVKYLDGRFWRVWADGRTEGFGKIPARDLPLNHGDQHVPHP